MARLRRFLSLPLGERVLLVRAVGLVALLRIGVTVLSFPLLRRLVDALGRARRGAPRPTERVVWVVTVASRLVPRATCLTQALAVQVLLRRQGTSATVRIGVTRDAQGRFESHAWTESAGRIVIGDAQPGRYVPLAVWDGEQG